MLKIEWHEKEPVKRGAYWTFFITDDQELLICYEKGGRELIPQLSCGPPRQIVIQTGDDEALVLGNE